MTLEIPKMSSLTSDDKTDMDNPLTSEDSDTTYAEWIVLRDHRLLALRQCWLNMRANSEKMKMEGKI